ncbi:MAG: pyridoxal-phosphate dependent enzyme, partial [Chloroflexota bacterium]
THLECTATGQVLSADEPQGLSPAGKVFYPRYDLVAARREVDRDALASRPASMWRFLEVLPGRDAANVVTLGEGGTPMLRARNVERATGSRTVYIKDEGVNPTGSFKARGMAAAGSRITRGAPLNERP